MPYFETKQVEPCCDFYTCYASEIKKQNEIFPLLKWRSIIAPLPHSIRTYGHQVKKTIFTQTFPVNATLEKNKG